MDYTGFIILILVFVRVISFLGASPIMTIRGIPNIAKIGTGLFLSILIFNFVQYNPEFVPSSMTGLMVTAAGECVFGLTMGYIATLFLNAIMMSGQLMDFQVGFTMASEFDPFSANNVSILGNLEHFIGLMIFFLVDGHHMLIGTLIQSFEIVPVLGVNIPPEVGPYVFSLFIKIFILSLKLAAPVIVVLFLTEFTMGLIARNVPQLNIMILGLPVKIIVGLLVFSAALPALIHAYVKAFQDIPGDLNNYFNLFPLIVMFASADKTEEPTPKKREDARKKGQVAKSRELISAITLIGITLLIVTMGSFGLNSMQAFLTRSLNNVGRTYLGEGDLINLSIYTSIEFMKITLPVFSAVLLLGVISNLVQTGFIHSGEPLKPNLSRLNPLEGFKRMFSGRAFMELLKACANIAIIGYVAVSFVKDEFPKILKISDLSVNSIIALSKDIVQSELARVAVVVLILGIIDFVYQRYAYNKEMRMTKQEVKEEFKQMEGDPQIKSKIRQKQREMAQRRMMHEVSKATVVITNPTHLAVAIKYEKGKMGAPVVVAKGADSIANRIKQIAKENNVPIVENKPVARMLYNRVEINDSIPVEMYQAVAEILAFVYSLKKKM